jgi:hypothetical protein
MTGITRSVPNQASAGTTGPIRRRQGGRYRFFFTKMLHYVQHFCEKDTTCIMLPQAKTAIVGVQV